MYSKNGAYQTGINKINARAFLHAKIKIATVKLLNAHLQTKEAKLWPTKIAEAENCTNSIFLYSTKKTEALKMKPRQNAHDVKPAMAHGAI